jgi:dihydroflavonol-4-reductase
MIVAAAKGGAQERYLTAGRYLETRALAALMEQVSGVRAPRFRAPYCVAILGAHLTERAARRAGRATSASVEGLRTLRTRMAFSSQKAERELGLAFRPLEDTVRDALAWLREHAPRQSAQ